MSSPSRLSILSAPRLSAAFALIAASCLSRPALAQSPEDLGGDPVERIVLPGLHSRTPRAARARPARSLNTPDSIWIGHSIQTQNPLDHTTFSFGPYHVGVGLFRPKGAGSAAENSGFWDWDHFDQADSLQGWWPMRRVYGITGGLTFADTDRPWWAVDIGNQGNYVLNSNTGRTRGVLSYWHVDGGSVATQVRIPGTNALPMTWAPLDGNGSAWCGLRAHGDMTYVDPITGNPYNATVMEFNGENGGGVGSGVGTSKSFPGYPSQMDQMLYRDVEMTAPNASLNLTFLYQTAMSTSATSTVSTRAGWFQFDPTVVGPVAVAGPNAGIPNFISNTGVGQPADSFMVYLGVPVDIDNLYLADGSHHVPGATPHGVYDLKRRWFSEVLRLDMPIVEVLHVSGNVNTSFTLSGQDLSTLYAAQGGATHKYLRLVFRCKTNRGFDDLTGGTTGAFNSGGKGAVMIDDVGIGGTGLAGGAVGYSHFESPSEIDNSDGATPGLATGAWRATGKPPAIFWHTHPLAGGNGYIPLNYQSICSNPGFNSCNMTGVVVSAGDHDNGEAAGGLTPGTPERERMDGMISPTILLASSGAGDYNACGVDRAAAAATDDYYIWYDVYAGIFNLNFTGNAWFFGAQSYPAQQLDGVKCWGELRVYPGPISTPTIACFTDYWPLRAYGVIRTTNPGSVPDSLRIFLGKVQECFRFGISGSACSSTAGAYFDNVSLLLSNAPLASFGPSVAVEWWRWVNDTFPANDGTSLSPGVAVLPGTAGFDTAAAYLKSGLNTAQTTGDANRLDIPGDSMIVIGDVIESTTGLGRVDMVFRIKPGVGNYKTVGDPSSGLRRIPADPASTAQSGVFVSDPLHPEKDFWSAYMAAPGEMSKGVHGPGDFWNRNVWNSARIDTADVNIFPVQANIGVFDVNQNFFATVNWMACYHEEDPKYALLGVTHNRCFLVNPAPSAPVNSTNITCSGAPGVYGAAAGYDGVPTTKEGTKVIPDGLLTPGAHVQYFFRGQDDGGLGPPGLARNDARFFMVPETTFVSPQFTESSTDGHRWQQFGVLPDRWKDVQFGGQGMACMLYVDAADAEGDERVWVSTADSIGFTSAAQRGAHNGWRARGDQSYEGPDSKPIDVSTDPSIARYDHGGQPGTVWDMYGVKGGLSPTTPAGSLGGRLAPQATGLAAGKDSRQGPTPAMLRTYYPVVMIHTDELITGLLGPFVNRGQNDVALFEDYLSNPAPGTPATTKRSLIIEGEGFVRSEYTTGSGAFPGHLTFLTDYLGLNIKKDGAGNPQYAYQPWSGNSNQYADLTTGSPFGSNLYSIGNSCLWPNAVLDPVANALNAQASAYYANVGSNGPYVASVYTPFQPGKLYDSMVDGWDPKHLYSPGGNSTYGRLGFYFQAASHLRDAIGCVWTDGPLIPLDVPGGNLAPLVNYVQLRNNPMISGRAIVHMGLARTDRVTARIFDVGGRLVRTLADRVFPPGEHDLAWDGSDDHGRAMPRGVYFSEIRYAASGFRAAKKLIVLR